MIAEALGIEVGWYYHFAADLHIYEKHYKTSGPTLFGN
jgi:thymidylate synthase